MLFSRRPSARFNRGRISGKTGPAGTPPSGLPAVPTLTAPANNGNVFNGAAATVSASTSDTTLTKMEWVLDPSGANTVVATVTGAGTPPGTFSTTWTPTGVSDGAHTLVARATNGAGSTDTIIASNNADFTISNSLLQRTSHGDLNLANFENFNITGGSSANSVAASRK